MNNERKTLSLDEKFAAVADISPAWERVKHFTWADLTGMRDRIAALQAKVDALKAEVARLSAPVTDGDEEPDTCEGCEEPLRIDEGHETEDMVMLCDKCWQGLLDDPDCHSEECPCEKCILARATPPQDVEKS